jgi:hypothetical protein
VPAQLIRAGDLYPGAPYAYAAVAPPGSADQHDLIEVWEVVHAAFGDHDPPSTLLGVTVLGYSGQLVEIEAVALAVRQGPAARDQPALQAWPT